LSFLIRCISNSNGILRIVSIELMAEKNLVR
jgi:hypothetical protein